MVLHHTFDVQLLKDNGSVSLRQLCRLFVQEVSPLVLNPPVTAGDFHAGLLPVLAALLLARQRLLQLRQLLFRLAEVARVFFVER